MANTYLKNPGTINYALFRTYSYALVSWLNTFDPLYRRSSQSPHSTYGAGAQDFRVIYGNPERVFSSQRTDPALMSNERLSPMGAVYLKGFKPEPTYNIPHYLKFKQHYYLPSGRLDTQNSFAYSKLQTFSLDYSCSFFMEFKSDIDYMAYSILREFDNGKIKWILAYKKGTSHLGQYIPFKLESHSDTSSLNPGDAKDLRLTFDLAISVPWAYLPKDALSHPVSAVAEQVNFNLETDKNDIMVEDNVEIK